MTKTDIELCRLMMSVVLKSHPVIEKEGKFFWQNSDVKDNLSKDKKDALDLVLKKSGEGIELTRLQGGAVKKAIGELIKLDLLVSLDGNIVYHRQVYNDMKNSIMKLFDSKDKIGISDAKEATGLSRKYLIPLLNRIEREGKIKRLGDFRVKV